MIQLIEVNEENWIDYIRLSVTEEQQKYLDRPTGIREGRFDGVEVCVNREDLSALCVYEKVGFVDSGYIDKDLPNCLNLIYHLK